MRITVHSFLMALAIVCFVLSAFGVSTWKGDKHNLTAAGLALWALAILIGSA